MNKVDYLIEYIDTEFSNTDFSDGRSHKVFYVRSSFKTNFKELLGKLKENDIDIYYHMVDNGPYGLNNPVIQYDKSSEPIKDVHGNKYYKIIDNENLLDHKLSRYLNCILVRNDKIIAFLNFTRTGFSLDSMDDNTVDILGLRDKSFSNHVFDGTISYDNKTGYTLSVADSIDVNINNLLDYDWKQNNRDHEVKCKVTYKKKLITISFNDHEDIVISHNDPIYKTLGSII